MRRRLIVSVLAVLFSTGVVVGANATAASADTSSPKYVMADWCC